MAETKIGDIGVFVRLMDAERARGCMTFPTDQEWVAEKSPDSIGPAMALMGGKYGMSDIEYAAVKILGDACMGRRQCCLWYVPVPMWEGWLETHKDVLAELEKRGFKVKVSLGRAKDAKSPFIRVRVRWY